MRWISFKAIFMGVVAMLAIDLFVGLATLALWPGLTADGNAGTAPAQMQPGYLAFAFVSGSLSTAIGGGLCARQAAALPYWNALAFGVVTLFIGMLLSDPAQPWWFTALAFISTIPMGLVGASVALKHRPGT